MATVKRLVEWEVLGLRLLILVSAVVSFYAGYALLTSPLWAPVTIGIWLGASALVAIALTLHVPDRLTHTTAETPDAHWCDRWIA